MGICANGCSLLEVLCLPENQCCGCESNVLRACETVCLLVCSVSTNTTLEELTLPSNLVGDAGAMALAEALRVRQPTRPLRG